VNPKILNIPPNEVMTDHGSKSSFEFSSIFGFSLVPLYNAIYQPSIWLYRNTEKVGRIMLKTIFNH